MAAIRLAGLAKRYGGITALLPLDLNISDGEFVCVLGPSGSGKSTLLKLVAGVEEPTGGRVFFDGEDVTHVTPERRDVAMVFQSYALYGHLSVADNLAFPLKGGRGGAASWHRGPAAPAPAQPVRWGASAGRAGAGDHPTAQGVFAGRAAVEPRRQPALADAARAEEAA
jgi:ABC-type sugar transport system ATPase subunit